jgi:uncharacterized Zn finger protein
MKKQYKTCSRCGFFKHITEFYKDKSQKDNLTYYCKSCIRIYQRSKFISKKKHINKYTDEYKKQFQHQYYIDNIEYCRMKNKEYYQKNKLRIKLKMNLEK